jgi:hypothetical protein
VEAHRDEPAGAPVDELLASLRSYAGIFLEVTGIAMDGANDEELAGLSSVCLEEAVETRAAEAALPADAPAEAAELLRALYESLVVLAGIERVADTLSLPVASCANGDSLRAYLRARGPLAAWVEQESGERFDPPHLPATLIARDRTTTGGALRWSLRRRAANVDRSADEGAKRVDLNELLATRIGEALTAWRAPEGRDAAADARRFGPLLLGFARVADRGRGGLRPPAGALPLARLLADALVARTAPDVLAPADRGAIDDAAASLGEWLAR